MKSHFNLEEFEVKFNQLKNHHKEKLNHYFLADDDFKWTTLSFRKNDVYDTSKQHFITYMGYIPILIDSQNNDIYCLLSEENKIGVFALHTIVHIYNDINDMLDSIIR